MRPAAPCVRLLAILGSCAGSTATQHCPPDQNWDTHPLFGAVTSSPLFFSQEHARQATSLRFGDLNGDGLDDAVCAVSITDSYVTILLGRGDGTFERRFRVDAGDEDALETCDAWPVDPDGDGDLDIATANARTDDCTMLFNDGEANFTRGDRYPLGDEPRSIVAGDLDGDGDPDLAYLNVLSRDVSVLLDRGDGTFDPEVRIAVGGTTGRGQSNRTFPYPGPFLAIGDIDDDLDIMVPGGFEIEILLNDGAGGFTLRDEHPLVDIATRVYDIKAVDLDGDEDLDLAAALYGGRAELGVWLKAGDGMYGEVSRYDASVMGDGLLHFSTTVGVGDIDGDLDAVIGNELWGAYGLLRNRGDGIFAPFEAYLDDEGPWLLEIRDVNGDDWADVISAPSHSFRISHVIAHLNDGTGTPQGTVNS